MVALVDIHELCANDVRYDFDLHRICGCDHCCFLVAFTIRDRKYNTLDGSTAPDSPPAIVLEAIVFSSPYFHTRSKCDVRSKKDRV